MHGTLHVGSIKGKAPARRFRQDEIFDCAHQKADQKSNDHVNDAQNHPGNQKEVKFCGGSQYISNVSSSQTYLLKCSVSYFKSKIYKYK